MQCNPYGIHMAFVGLQCIPSAGSLALPNNGVEALSRPEQLLECTIQHILTQQQHAAC
jgi:hypothetical protein